MTEVATFAGGCFWCMEAVFRPLRGVERIVSGYIGGRLPNPSYAAVCTGVTGHAEAIQISFDSSVISYLELLEFFFAFHDPTTLNQQGPDEGTQYRSGIFYHSTSQREEAERTIQALEKAGTFPGAIVTELTPATEFYPAEASHQDYFRRNPDNAYCQATITPKLAKLRRKYAERLARPV
ncbi:MAG TPA: peptide-methionine (S)-S-oxide reductase MsrA [Gemmatimonadales bacterium]|nr:peptide-methionine (S)-S-oxide reductase MsrA [Gemmatimonadales bacterium]